MSHGGFSGPIARNWLIRLCLLAVKALVWLPFALIYWAARRLIIGPDRVIDSLGVRCRTDGGRATIGWPQIRRVVIDGWGDSIAPKIQLLLIGEASTVCSASGARSLRFAIVAVGVAEPRDVVGGVVGSGGLQAPRTRRCRTGLLGVAPHRPRNFNS
jgi:hypothetical protein